MQYIRQNYFICNSFSCLVLSSYLSFCEIHQYFLISYVFSLRGLKEATRGWSVSLLAGEGWTDLAGCDFVMDLLAGVEADVPQGHPPAQTDYLFSNTGDRYASIELSADS